MANDVDKQAESSQESMAAAFQASHEATMSLRSMRLLEHFKSTYAQDINSAVAFSRTHERVRPVARVDEAESHASLVNILAPQRENDQARINREVTRAVNSQFAQMMLKPLGPTLTGSQPGIRHQRYQATTGSPDLRWTANDSVSLSRTASVVQVDTQVLSEKQLRHLNHLTRVATEAENFLKTKRPAVEWAMKRIPALEKTMADLKSHFEVDTQVLSENQLRHLNHLTRVATEAENFLKTKRPAVEWAMKRIPALEKTMADLKSHFEAYDDHLRNPARDDA
ncbi:uncharacterized protein IWZ02DRAFT_195784 [Phyllosticta citriasiana]|uniref:uncharacterized protein n=1 Tax=Phyllosticta citriasiana TaxID=595635 RepID=UPI0030FD21E0